VQNPQGNFRGNFQGHLQGNLQGSRQGGGTAIEPADRNDAYHSVVTDLVALIEHVQASLRSIEQEIARETASGSQESSSDVIELDDVTPPYVRATSALKACDANLAIALHSLLDSKIPEHGAGDHAWSPPALSIIDA
jgi:hypothetical protein